MKDFQSFIKDQQPESEKPEDLAKEVPADTLKTAQKIAQTFGNKSENDIFNAILSEAEKGRRNGTLSDADLDNFYNMLAPMFDGKKRQKLKDILAKLKQNKLT